MTRLNNEKLLESDNFPFHAAPYMFKPGENVSAHSHEFVELAYIAKGIGEHQYNNGEYHQISEGDVFIIEPDVEHAYRAGSNNPLLVYNVMFTPALLKSEIEAMSSVTHFVNFFYVEPFLRNSIHFNSHLTLRPQQQIEMNSLVNRLILECKEKKIGYQIMIKTRMIELFVFLSRCYQEISSPMKSLEADETIMLNMIEFINRHYTQPLTLAQISQISGMSSSVFSVKFKQYIGKTFIEYRNEIRVRTAQEALIKTTKKISAISQDIGFDDLSFFNKLFKKITGVSPGEYRKRYSRNSTIGAPS